MKRLRITNYRPDGTKSTDPPSGEVGLLPIPRGKDLIATILNEDGTESPLPAFRSLRVMVTGRTNPIVATVEFYDVDLVLECACEVMQSPEISRYRAPHCPRHSE